MRTIARMLLASAVTVSATSQTATAQNAGRSAAAVTAGAVAGAAVGLLAGGLIGASIGERGCETGNPDACLGEAMPGFIWGAGLGMTIGIPVGAHIANRRQGSLGTGLAVSALLFGLEVIALNALVDDGRTEHKRAVTAIAAAVPVVQIVTSVLLERRE